MDRRLTLQAGEGVPPGQHNFVTPNTKARLDAEFLGETLPQPTKFEFSKHPPGKRFVFNATSSSEAFIAPARKVLNSRDLHKSQGSDLGRRQDLRRGQFQGRQAFSRFATYSRNRVGLMEGPLPTDPQAQKRAIVDAMGLNSNSTRRDKLATFRKKKEEERKAAEKAKVQTRKMATSRFAQMQNDVAAPPKGSGLGKTSASQGTAPKVTVRSTTATATTSKVQIKENIDPVQSRSDLQRAKATSKPVGATSNIKTKAGSQAASVSDGRRVTRAMAAANKDVPFARQTKLPASGRGGAGNVSSLSGTSARGTAASGRGTAASGRGTAASGRGTAAFGRGTAASGRGTATSSCSTTSSAPRGIRGGGGKTLLTNSSNCSGGTEVLPSITEKPDLPTPQHSAGLMSQEGHNLEEPQVPTILESAVSQNQTAPPREAKFGAIDECYLGFSLKFSNTCTQLYQEREFWEGQLAQMFREEQLAQTVPEEKAGDVASIIGKLTLLLSSKLPSFVGLLSRYLQKNSIEQPILEDDLGGWWDTVSIQVNKVLEESTNLRDCQIRNWVEEVPVEIEKEVSKHPAPRVKKINSTGNVKFKEFLAQQRLNKAKSVGSITPDSVQFVLEKTTIKGEQNVPEHGTRDTSQPPEAAGTTNQGSGSELSEVPQQLLETSETTLQSSGRSSEIAPQGIETSEASPQTPGASKQGAAFSQLTVANEPEMASTVNDVGKQQNSSELPCTPEKFILPPARTPHRTPRSVKRINAPPARDVRRTSLLQMRLSVRGRISDTGNHQLSKDTHGFNFNPDISLMQLGLDMSFCQHSKVEDSDE